MNEGFPNLDLILDGKQRLSTIIAFYEDRLKYKGYYWSELSERDRNIFLSRTVSKGEIRGELSKKELIELFISINTTGKTMGENHIEKLKNKLKEME